MAEVHGNRTHLTAFGRYTGFEDQSTENAETLDRQASSHFLDRSGFSELLPILGVSRGEVKWECNSKCNQENALDFRSSEAFKDFIQLSMG